MAAPEFVQLAAQPIERYRPLVGEERFAEIERMAARAREAFSGRAIWHVNSTAKGGGVAEILYSLLPYARAAGVDTRWVVVGEGAEFFAVTKRIHNHLHEDAGDGGPLGEAERAVYESALGADADALGDLVQEGDVVYLHDPQTAGLVEPMRRLAAKVIWRCHIGVDRPGPLARGAWDFLRPYVVEADAFVFSRREYVWEGLDADRAWLMPPAIDAFAPKNQELDAPTVDAILQEIGLLADGPRRAPGFNRSDGTPDRVERRAEILQVEPFGDDAQVVVQVSRWDRLKDPLGLLACFERHLGGATTHLVLAGPSTAAVADDPEGAEVHAEVAAAWRALPDGVRRRAHLVSLPMDDLEENGAMVNALQRRADVLVQKSLAEGFGLVVAEGMWKARPFVGSRVGGIQDQIVAGESGVLVEDPRDLRAFGREIAALLGDPERATRLGAAARQRVADHFLAIGRLAEYVELVAGLTRS
jgi:trehalose synthase